MSSGEGGVFPPGLPVGVVAALGPGGPRIEPYVELSQLGYVLVVDYGLSNALPQPDLDQALREADVDIIVAES